MTPVQEAERHIPAGYAVITNEINTPSAQWRATAELRWAATFLGPWLGRRLRGQSSGDQRTAKHPRLHRIEGPRS